MPDINQLFEQNRAWAAQMETREPGFFAALEHQQSPQYVWIGCSDSRVPANQIIGLVPGEVFVHRNVGNVVVHTDLNCLSVLQFAVDVLRVTHVLVVGHYGCAGVMAALLNRRFGLIDNWLRHIQDVRLKHAELLDSLPEARRPDSLCELNVIEQVVNACQTTVVREAWERGQKLSVHGWVYALNDGLIRDLQISVGGPDETAEACRTSVAAVRLRSSR
ncbi:MAG: carbonic anhydrase [Verrucomicrobiota bacterium]|jgi:carbonic anhydrase|nr:carbonic anhydrase [Verrucomicrobiota bacterium]